MCRVGKHSGDAVDEVPAPIDRQRLIKFAAGFTATIVAWGYLVYLAIDFGTAARDGSGFAWFLLLLATIGATACMFVALIVGNMVLMVLRGEAPRRPTPGGGRRAAR